MIFKSKRCHYLYIEESSDVCHYYYLIEECSELIFYIAMTKNEDLAERIEANCNITENDKKR